MLASSFVLGIAKEEFLPQMQEGDARKTRKWQRAE
jgi:hypothetical protein